MSNTHTQWIQSVNTETSIVTAISPLGTITTHHAIQSAIHDYYAFICSDCASHCTNLMPVFQYASHVTMETPNHIAKKHLHVVAVVCEGCTP